MKLLTRKKQLRQKRIAYWRMQERTKRRTKKKVRTGNYFVRASEEIKAPEQFDMTRGSGKEVVKFLRAVSNRVLNQRKHVVLNFKATTQFYVPGAILLFAELDRIIQSSKLAKPVKILEPRQQKSRQVMKQIGIFELTGDTSEVIPTREDVVYWKAIKGKNQSGSSYGAFIEAIAEKVSEKYTTQDVLKELWRSVNEAIANTTDHAYTHPRFDSFTGLEETKWWMFTQIRDDTFTIAVCDLGCGYLKTINKNIPESLISSVKASLGWSNLDALAIETAMEYGRSGTKLNHRGKGSRDVLSLVENHGHGRVIVMSNTGWMTYNFTEGKQVGKNSAELGIDIGGTIVWWSLPLKGRENVDN